MPKYSFIVPVYNGENTIEETIRSIQSQSYQDFELIVVDNNSNDKTAEKVSQFSGVRSYFCKKRGRSIARNLGAEKATGTYLAFVDADVLLSKDWLDQVDRYLQEFPLDAVSTKIVPYSANQTILNEYRKIYGAWKTDGTFLNLRQPKAAVVPLINTAACVLSRHSFEKVGGFDRNLVRQEDLDLSIRMFKAGYLLGGTSRAKARVQFEINSNLPLADYIAYLTRAFEIRLHGLWPVSFKALLNMDFCLEMLWRKRDPRLLLLAFGVEAASISGYLVGRLRKPSFNWKQQRGPNALIFCFSYRGKAYYLKRGLNFIFVDQEIFLITEDFHSRRLDGKDRAVLMALVANGKVSSTARKRLVEMGLFSPVR